MILENQRSTGKWIFSAYLELYSPGLQESFESESTFEQIIVGTQITMKCIVEISAIPNISPAGPS